MAADDILGEELSPPHGSLVEEVGSGLISAVMEVLAVRGSRIIFDKIIVAHIVGDVPLNDIDDSSGLNLSVLSRVAEDGEDLVHLLIVQEFNEISIHLGPEQGLIGTSLVTLLRISLLEDSGGNGQHIDDYINEVISANSGGVRNFHGVIHIVDNDLESTDFFCVYNICLCLLESVFHLGGQAVSSVEQVVS